MLVKPTLDELLPRTENRYTLAILVAKRARQLMNGALPMVQSETPNMVTLSCEEIAEGDVTAIPGKHDVCIPERPEVIEARRLAAAAKEDNARLEILHDESVIEVSAKAKVEAPLDLDDLTASFDAANEEYMAKVSEGAEEEQEAEEE